MKAVKDEELVEIINYLKNVINEKTEIYAKIREIPENIACINLCISLLANCNYLKKEHREDFYKVLINHLDEYYIEFDKLEEN